MAKSKAQDEGQREAEDQAAPEKINRAVAAARALKEMGDEGEVGQLSARADELFVKGGGKSDIETAEAWVWSALETAEELGLVEVVSMVRRQQ